MSDIHTFFVRVGTKLIPRHVLKRGEEIYIVVHAPDQRLNAVRVMSKWMMDPELSFDHDDLLTMSVRVGNAVEMPDHRFTSEREGV